MLVAFMQVVRFTTLNVKITILKHSSFIDVTKKSTDYNITL